jgi:penicillin-binding protein 1B
VELRSAVGTAFRRIRGLTSHLRRRTVLWTSIALILLAAIVGAVRFVSDVHALRGRRASGPAWSFPSRIYSADLPLREGDAVPPGYLTRELDVRGYRRSPPPLGTPGTYAEIAGGAEIFLRGVSQSPDSSATGGPERIRVTMNRGRIAHVSRLGGLPGAPSPDGAHPPRLEPMLVSVIMDDQRVRRTWVPLARIPRIVRDAIVSSEDRRFRSHLGLDLRSNARALFVNVRAGGVRQGGSTITQQVARGLFLGRERTWSRKLSEAGLAVGLEIVLSKDEILEMYLNSVYWGQGDGEGVAGIAEASRYFFDLPVDSLGLEEGALLAGLIPAPNAYTPFVRPVLARRERDRVLSDMVQTGLLDAATAARVRARPLRLRHGLPPAEHFPSYAGAVREELARRIAPGAAEHLGLSVFTALDPAWQADAETTLGHEIGALGRDGRGARLEGAFVVLDPATGAIRCLVGGRSAAAGDFDRATHALRQPGSAIKPIVYAAALDPGRGGRRLTPASTVPDLRREFATPEGPWSPRNDENDYHDQVTLAKALAKSLNVATANLVELIGPGVVARYAERFGLGHLRAVPSIGLGTNEVTLLALAGAYTTFPNGGLRPEASTLRAVADASGRPVGHPPAPPVRVIPAETAALMTGLLEDVVIFGVSYPLRKVYGFARPVGAKTGTTNDYNDAWFIGFTPDVVAGAWVGFDQPRNLAAPAAEVALPVWAHIMTRLLEGFEPREFPSDRTLALAWIDPWTGGNAGPGCPSVMRVPFLPGTAPTQPCRRDHTADWEALRERRAADSLAALARDTMAVVDSAAVLPTR